MSYRLVDELQLKAIPVVQVCRLLGVSRSGFYEARHRRASKLAICKASVHVRAAYMESGQKLWQPAEVKALANKGLQR